MLRVFMCLSEHRLAEVIEIFNSTANVLILILNRVFALAREIFHDHKLSVLPPFLT